MKVSRVDYIDYFYDFIRKEHIFFGPLRPCVPQVLYLWRLVDVSPGSCDVSNIQL